MWHITNQYFVTKQRKKMDCFKLIHNESWSQFHLKSLETAEISHWKNNSMNIQSLKWFVKEDWEKLPVEKCKKFIDGNKNCLETIIIDKRHANKFLYYIVYIFCFYFSKCSRHLIKTGKYRHWNLIKTIKIDPNESIYHFSCYSLLVHEMCILKVLKLRLCIYYLPLEK